jgi:biofilm PGA synthesis N-glycosyltransferase PgaC
VSQRLLVISPVRNERAHIERVAAALAAQTRPPDLWIVVDDTSTDGTAELVAELAAEIGFLRLAHVSRPHEAQAQPQSRDRLAIAAEVRAFNRALRRVQAERFTHIAKLDGDTELPPHYFQTLLARFAQDDRLGLAGGVYADPAPPPQRWKVVHIPNEHHVPGSLKCYSLACFQAIGGMQERLAWDTLDETYARMLGFRTRSFADLVALHHRPRASADGTLRGRARHGQCAYIAHFTPSWVALRAFKLAAAPPRGLSGLAFLYGYARSAFDGTRRVQDPQLRAFVHRELRDRMSGELRRRLRRGHSSATGFSVSSQ